MRGWLKQRRRRIDDKVLEAIRRGARHGLSISERAGVSSGQLYPSLARLERLGFVWSRWENPKEQGSASRRRRLYFAARPAARAHLPEDWEHYVDEDGYG